MGNLYSRIIHLQLDDKKEDKTEVPEQIKSCTISNEPKTPLNTVPKYLLDPRSATAEIKRTPLLIMMKNADYKSEEADSTPVRPLPYLETDLDESICTIRTSTPVMSASPMKDILQSSPVLKRSLSIGNSSNELSISEQDEIFNVDSDEDDETEQLFNNERMLFESDEQGLLDEEEIFTKDVEMDSSSNADDIYLLSEDSCETDIEVEGILSDLTNSATENSLERQFSEIEDCVFSAVNPTIEESTVIKSLSALAPHLKLDNHLAKTKSGRTPLGIVSSNPCSPLQPSGNLIIMTKKGTDDTKQWRGPNEERVNRGLLDVENTPPLSSVPPPDVIQSAPGKMLLSKRGRNGKAAWGRDNSLII